jgi:hypothetical protein
LFDEFGDLGYHGFSGAFFDPLDYSKQIAGFFGKSHAPSMGIP